MSQSNDLMVQLLKTINTIDGLPMKCKLGYLTAGEAFDLYPLPGSRLLKQDYSGTQHWQMNYEVGYRTKNQETANTVLWIVSQALDLTTSVESANGSYTFESLEINGQPSVSEQDTQGYTTYMLDFSVYIYTN
ncbi:putative minor capsid protein, phage associated [Secundilactobacillus pentosiphilus]|uniref:Putative minor capsid protein, phage associated n=1 Tax=Secundilactobacillus pentosiphilus TaxID=1714682 RepID=A0A1Z5IYC2_9LACO|nr:minor capsid protein [Secundilactobacillus pentosiphilus]GAX06810.1 putative minor capsid protein, phage associated [Secundilactobacillus pentosiphilus]